MEDLPRKLEIFSGVPLDFSKDSFKHVEQGLISQN